MKKMQIYMLQFIVGTPSHVQTVTYIQKKDIKIVTYAEKNFSGKVLIDFFLL